MNEKYKTLFKGKKWSMAMHLNMGDKGVLVHTNEELGVTRRITTPKTKGRWGKQRAVFIIDKTGDEYGTIEELGDALLAMGIDR